MSRKADTEFVFDVDLALKQNDENQVFYVQYAHARICSVLRAWEERGGDAASLANADLSRLVAPSEAALMLRLSEFPDVLTAAARDLAPHDIARRSGREWKVERQHRGVRPADLAGPSGARIEGVLMGRDVQHVGIVPEDRLRAVAVMHVPVHDEHPLAPSRARRGRHGDVVQQAEAHGAFRQRVVTWWANRHEGHAFSSPLQLVDA